MVDPTNGKTYFYDEASNTKVVISQDIIVNTCYRPQNKGPEGEVFQKIYKNF